MQLATKDLDNTNQVFIGRQPILDRNLKTCAYELLFRPGLVNQACFPDGDVATARVIHNTLMEVGIRDLVGSKLAFINFTRATLLGDFVRLLPKDQAVLEILEDVEIDEELIAGVQKLAAEGYIFALDDFKYSPEWEPLVQVASIIKYDLTRTPMSDISHELEQIRGHHAKLLAEKVETIGEYEHFRDLGFDYFQGYFFARPTTICRTTLPDQQVAVMRLLTRLQDPEIQIEEAESLVSRNISLSFKILRYINSPAVGFRRKIESIQQAIVLFGLKQLKSWACVMAMTEVDGKPTELMLNGLIRARLCQLIAQSEGREDGDSYFMVGLFSILDALMDTAMDKILEQLPVSEGVRLALLKGEGSMGAALRSSLACEMNSFSAAEAALIDQATLNRLYLSAITWADEAMP